MSIGDYFGKLQPLWDELATYDPIPSCGCGLCMCQLGKKFQQKQDNDRLHDFLYGIHVDHFGALRSSLLSQNPPPTLDRAYHAMLQEEQLMSQLGVSLDRDNVMAMTVQSSSRGTSRFDPRNKTNGTCSYCHRSGHEISNCFSKNGFLDWWGDRPRGSGQGEELKPARPMPKGGQSNTAGAGRGRDTAHAVYTSVDGSIGAALAAGSAGQVHAARPSLSESYSSKLKTLFGHSDSGSDHMPVVEAASDGLAGVVSDEEWSGDGGVLREDLGRVAKIVTVRIFIAVAAIKNWEMHQMVMHNAFLAPRSWFSKLAMALKRYGFIQSYSEYSLFTLCKGKVRLHVLVYVDDLIIVGNNFDDVANVMKYLVHVLSQFLHEPHQDHWTTTLRVVKYLKGCPGQWILFSAKRALKLSGWCDSDRASCPITRTSVSGSWKSKKQDRVSRSSVESEYRSMAIITYLHAPI
ncbi:hypothetical protein LIER_37257 [Lithospermum erythrorhizon]|uniref:Reverse transcriptase Ty1/copia-type domain-containing protein n=1 Tax=Lithospermum erythrorhizon TaxID=34254 RepID=A0AAV3PHP5_LITER